MQEQSLTRTVVVRAVYKLIESSEKSENSWTCGVSLLGLHHTDVLSKPFIGLLAINLSQYNNTLLINGRHFNY